MEEEKAEATPLLLALHFDRGGLVARGLAQGAGLAWLVVQPGEEGEGIEGRVARGGTLGGESGVGAGEFEAEEGDSARDGVGGLASAFADERLREAGQGGPGAGESLELDRREGSRAREGAGLFAESRAGGGIRAKAGDGGLELG